MCDLRSGLETMVTPFSILHHVMFWVLLFTAPGILIGLLL